MQPQITCRGLFCHDKKEFLKTRGKNQDFFLVCSKETYRRQ